MNYSYINQLIARYWDGLTTVEEEQILRSFFSQEEVPDELKPYAAHFAALEHHRGQHLGADFDERILARLGNVEPTPVVTARPLTLSDRVRPYFRAAAAVAIVALIAGSVDHALTQGAAERQAQIAAQKQTADSLSPELETLSPVQDATRTASADSTETILLY